MTVKSTAAVTTPVATNGNKVTFNFGFEIQQSSHLQVIQSDDVTLLEIILTTGFTVSGAGNENGGFITFTVAPVTGKKITMKRNITIDQLTDLRNSGAWLPENHEASFDLLTMFVQQLEEELGRAIQVNISSGTDPATLLAQAQADAAAAAVSAAAAAVSAAEAAGSAAGVGAPAFEFFIKTTDYTPGVTTTLTLATAPTASEFLIIIFDGIVQQPTRGGSTAWSLAGSVVTFTEALPDTEEIFIISGGVASVLTPDDNTVTSVKIVDGSIINVDINAAAAIAWTKISTTGVVTLADMANIASARIIGRVTAGSGVPKALTAAQVNTFLQRPEMLPFSLGDEVTLQTTGLKLSWRMRQAFELTAIFGELTTAATGATFVMDVHLNGTTIMATNKVDILVSATDDDGTATLSTTTLAVNDLLEFYVDVIGSTLAGKGPKINFIGYQL